MTNTKKRLYIQEVAPRDGFQNEKQFIDTQDKIAFINQLSDSGFAKIEATSFTSPRAIPAVNDDDMVMHEIKRHPDVVCTVLVPNVRGAERALALGVDQLTRVLSVSEIHNQAHFRMTRDVSLAKLHNLLQAVHPTK